MATKRQGKGMKKRECRELTEGDKISIRESFDQLDLDCNGCISVEELCNGIRVLGFNPTRQEATDMIQALDVDGKGHIEYTEYEEMMRKRLSAMEYERELLMDSFRKFDKNGDGTISLDELRMVLCAKGDTMSRADVEEMFREADVNKDGKISYSEFVEMIKEDF